MSLQTDDPTEVTAPITPRVATWWTATARTVRRVAGGLSRAPVAVGYVVVLWVVGAATGSLASGPSFHEDSRTGLLTNVGTGVQALSDGKVWTLLTAGLWCQGLASCVVSSIFVLVTVAPAERGLGHRPGERRLGRRWVFLLLVGCQVLGALLGVAVVWLGDLAGSQWLGVLADHIWAVGPTTGAAGVALALSYRLTALWRRRLRLVLIFGLAILALFLAGLQGVITFCGGMIGLAIGAIVFRRERSAHRSFASNAEARVLVALFVATSAIGPFAEAFAKNDDGPLSDLRSLVVSRPPSAEDVRIACDPATGVSGGVCRATAAFYAYPIVPAVFMGLVPALLLLVLAEGLRRGRRRAWIGAVATNLALIGLSAWQLAQTLDAYHALRLATPDYVWQYGISAMILPVTVTVVLVLTRRRFPLPMRTSSARTFTAVVLAVFLVVSAVYLIVGYAVRDQFAPVATFGSLVASWPKRFLPPAYLQLVGATFVPHGGTAKVLYVWTGVVFWVVALVGLFLIYRRPHAAVAAGAPEARRILVEDGGTALSYMGTWPGNDYWINDDRTAAVSYRVIANVAVTVGDPFGRPADRAAAVPEFAAFCDRQGWTACLYSVTPEVKAAADTLGWSALQVAEETSVPLAGLSFQGKKWQDVRTALNKAGKAGITAQWWTYPSAPAVLREQVRAISEEWVADKGLPEMGFTLGGLAELDDPDVRLLLAVDGDELVHGATSWMPVYRDGAPVAWTLDFLRRRSDGFRGVMEFLIASAALGFKEEGAEYVSLSGAPMARVERDTAAPDAPVQRLLDQLGRMLEPVYGFRSLLSFKAKFQPVYQPMYMCYADPLALPSIANAIGKAYLPHMSAQQVVTLVRAVT